MKHYTIATNIRNGQSKRARNNLVLVFFAFDDAAISLAEVQAALDTVAAGYTDGPALAAAMTPVDATGRRVPGNPEYAARWIARLDPELPSVPRFVLPTPSIAQLYYFDGTYREVNAEEEFRWCDMPEKLIDRCPCDKAHEASTEHPHLTQCHEQRLVPAFAPIPATALLRYAWHNPGRFSRLLASPPETLGAFGWVSGATLVDRRGWIPQYPHVRDLEFDHESYVERQEARQQRARAAAATRRTVRETCSSCVLREECKTKLWAAASCRPRTEADIQRAYEALPAQYDPRRLAEGAFTAAQVEFLVRKGGDILDQRCPDISSRRAECRYGRFHPAAGGTSMSYMLVPDAGDLSRYGRYATWDALVTAMPLIAAQFEAYQANSHRPLADAVYLRYGLMLRWHKLRRRRGWGREHELHYMYGSDDGVRFCYRTTRHVGYVESIRQDAMTPKAVVLEAYLPHDAALGR